MFEVIFLQFLNGLDKGSAYALIALGLTIVFGTLGVVNFAHGALFMLGAFCAVAFRQLLTLQTVTIDPEKLSPWGQPLEIREPLVQAWFGDFGAVLVNYSVPLSLLLTVPVMLLVGVAMERGIIGLRYRVVGREHLPDGPFVLAAKHQSAWDTIIFFVLLERPAYVLKKELLAIPLYGLYARRAGHIAVDRKAGAKALRALLEDSRRAVADGMVPVIFPQGTRTAPGTRLPYQPGVAALYKGLDLPVVPVALNSGLFWGRRAFRKRPGTIRLEFLPAIPPGKDRAGFMAELEGAIEQATDRLSAEGLSPNP